jgi:TolB-like protein
LKPGNVMVTPAGQVKMLDFGVARLAADAAGDAVSQTTSATTRVGTLAYMAPEQLFGSDVDARADLYSAGVMLYQMATERLPHEAPDYASLAQKILNEAPIPPRARRDGLSADLERVILRCLEKKPGARYPSADALAQDLRALAERRPIAGAAPSSIGSLVVLPLENLSRDPGEEYFADGMTDALIANFAHIAALRVISRTSAMRYKGSREPLPAIARALDVNAVVEGSVLRAGDRVRITAQLVDAAGDRTLWSGTYEREVGDMLALQSEVARAIVEEIRVKLTPRERSRLAGPRAIAPEALDAYLRARHSVEKRTAPALDRALELFRAALDIEPSWAPAWAGLADTWNLIGVFRLRRPSETFPMARSAAERALAIDPDMAEAHTALAFASLFFRWDFAAAEQGYRRAIAQAPGYANAYQWFADFLSAMGRTDEGLAAAASAMQLDPLSPVIALGEATVLYYARRYAEAQAECRRVIEIYPEFQFGHLDLGRALEAEGRLEEAEAAFASAARIAGADPLTHAPLGQIAGMRGDKARALDCARRLIESRRQRFVSPYTIANLHVVAGEKDAAFEWLERGLEERDPMMVYTKVHPRLDSLRGDARFDSLLRRVGLTR